MQLDILYYRKSLAKKSLDFSLYIGMDRLTVIIELKELVVMFENVFMFFIRKKSLPGVLSAVFSRD